MAQSGECTTGQLADVVASMCVAGPDALSAASLPSAMALAAGDATCSAAQHNANTRTTIERRFMREAYHGVRRRANRR
jgi:hypothetical protein